MTFKRKYIALRTRSRGNGIKNKIRIEILITSCHSWWTKGLAIRTEISHSLMTSEVSYFDTKSFGNLEFHYNWPYICHANTARSILQMRNKQDANKKNKLDLLQHLNPRKSHNLKYITKYITKVIIDVSKCYIGRELRSI